MSNRKMSTFERLQNGGPLNRQERRELQAKLNASDPGLQIVHPDAAGIDVGNASHFVAVPAGRDPQPVQEFGSWTADLQRMAAWLKSCGIRTVAMQSTGVYWIAVQEILEQAGFEVYLVNARGTKNLPGRKSDVQECQWLMKLHTYGLLRNSFRPPEEIRSVRTVWRLRDRLVKDAGRAIQQIQKALTVMNIRLAVAISDVSGVTGMAIVRAILKGQRDPHELAKLRDPRIRATEKEVASSLEGNWREDVLFELQQVVEGYDFLQRQIATCDERLQQYMAVLPARPMESEEVVEEPAKGSQQRRQSKPRSKNQPRFDLGSELRRVFGVDLTRISQRRPVCVLAGVSAAAGHQRRQGHQAFVARKQESGGRRIPYGGAVAIAQRFVFRRSLPATAGEIGGRERGQSNGPLPGPPDTPPAYQGSGLRGSRCGIL